VQSPAPPGKPALIAAQHEVRGRALTAEGKYDEAIAELTEAIRLQPDLARAYNARGYVYLLRRDNPHALADFDEAIRLSPGYTNAIQNREIVVKRMNKSKP
jgi:Flp pilus assembly protein TadD